MVCTKTDIYSILIAMMTLQQFFREHPKTAVAFSGGTDSAWLLCMADRYADQTAAIYVNTPFQPAFELADAESFCDLFNIPIIVIEYDILQLRQVTANHADRCYQCKRALFAQIRKAADALGYPDIADGTNASDDADDRPGMRALAELGILSPLRLCGITKEQIREESRRLGLFTADKPAYACLATRIPTGTPIDAQTLTKVEAAESALSGMGFSDFRVRCVPGGAASESSAKLEIREEQLPLFREKETEIRDRLTPLFERVCLSDHFR